MNPLALSDLPLTLREVENVARRGATVVVSPAVMARLQRARAVVTRLVSSGQSIYGLNSALGANTGKRLPTSEAAKSEQPDQAGIPDVLLAEYQRNALRARNVGVGTPCPTDVVRAMLLARIAGMRMGGSGISPPVFEALVAMLNAGVHPLVPHIGSIGVGDLAPLAALALVDVADALSALEPGAARRVQDPLSFRCIAQVHGAALAAWQEARAQVELELNSAADSPLVLDSGEMLSNGNFHIPALAIAFEALGLGLAQCAAMSVERSLKLLSPAFSGLPLQLTRHGPAHSGFAAVQKTLTSLYNRMRHLANPACLDFLPVSERIEDHAPMVMNVVEKTVAMLEPLHYLAAIEALIAAQAVDLREPSPRDSLGRGAARLHTALRAQVGTLERDRSLGPDIEAAACVLRAVVTDAR